MICTSCRHEIPPGLAHIRTSTFKQLAWCGSCWGARSPIPTQRVADSEKVAQ